MFEDTEEHFDKILKEEKTSLENFNATKPQNIPIGGLPKVINDHSSATGMSMISASHQVGQSSLALKKKTSKNDLTKTRQIELALSISIIFSNLSNDEEYIKVLLGADEWEQRYNGEVI